VISVPIDSTIERRLLVNYRADPEVVQTFLPAPLRPQLISGRAVAGVCFIRLGALRPVGVPASLGLRTENVAHRFAVEWDDETGTRVGVYVPRRDSDSLLTVTGGGRIFPGRHFRARFDIEEQSETMRIQVHSTDGRVDLDAQVASAAHLTSQLFGSTEAAVDFFRAGSLGLSPGNDGLDGVRLHCPNWVATPVRVLAMRSSLFDDQSRFRKGTCELDSALLMQDLAARWIPEQVHLGARPVAA
jgi:hypothetical protein